MTTIINTGEAPGAKGRRRLAEALYAQGMENTPIQHWMQGVGRLAQAASGGYQMYQLDQEDKDREKAATALLLNAPGLAAPSGANAARPEAPTPPTRNPMSTGVETAPKIYSQDQLNPIDVASAAGPRPGGPVMPSSKVWGDKEAEAAGLYEPTANRTAPVMAQGGPTVTPQASPVIPPDQAAYIRKLMSNPATRDYGTALYQKAVTENTIKPTDEIREFEYSQKNPAFKDYKTDLKRAGAIQNQVTIDQKGENEFSKEGGKLQAKRFDELAAEAPAARQMISDVETLRSLGSQIGTGKGATVLAALGPYAKAAGIDIGSLDEVQAYDMIISRVAPNLRVKGSGSQTDYELKNFLKSLPSLGNTPGGNEIGSQVLQGLYQNKIEAARIGAEALSGQIGRSEAEKRLRDLPDPMAGYREFIKKTKPAAAKAQQDIRSKYGLE